MEKSKIATKKATNPKADAKLAIAMSKRRGFHTPLLDPESEFYNPREAKAIETRRAKAAIAESKSRGYRTPLLDPKSDFYNPREAKAIETGRQEFVRCSRCRIILTDPESIKLGIGSECRRIAKRDERLMEAFASLLAAKFPQRVAEGKPKSVTWTAKELVKLLAAHKLKTPFSYMVFRQNHPDMLLPTVEAFKRKSMEDAEQQLEWSIRVKAA